MAGGVALGAWRHAGCRRMPSATSRRANMGLAADGCGPAISHLTESRKPGEPPVGGVYRPIALTREPDGILKGYSTMLRLSLCWAGGRQRLYDPVTNAYLEHWREVVTARAAAEAERAAAEARATVEQATRLAERAARSRAGCPRGRRGSEYGSLRRNCVAGPRKGSLSPWPSPGLSYQGAAGTVPLHSGGTIGGPDSPLPQSVRRLPGGPALPIALCGIFGGRAKGERDGTDTRRRSAAG